MLKDNGRGRGMTTHKETETTILKTFKGLIIGGREAGDS